MASQREKIFKGLRGFTAENGDRQSENVRVVSSETAREQLEHDRRVNALIQELSRRVRAKEDELHNRLGTRSLEFLSQPHHAPQQQLQQLRAIKSACEKLSNISPKAENYATPIPALIALRRTHNLIIESKESLSSTSNELKAIDTRLERERAALLESKELQEALKRRIEKLRELRDERASKTDEDKSEEVMKLSRRKKTYYERETRRLVTAMNFFIDERLAGMIAAEEIGGPVVGGMTEVTDDDLEAGFSAQGRRKKIRSGAERRSDGLRQRRIDEIWGRADDEEDEDEDERSERTAAAREVRDLLEDLLNVSIASVESGGFGSYVDLKRDSAAARFLVRAKVAQFHPRDARRIRLIDFGRDLED